MADEREFIVQGGIQSQSGTTTQNLHQAIGFPPLPIEYSSTGKVKPVILTAINSTSQTVNAVVALSTVRNSDGTNGLVVNSQGTALTMSAPTAVSVDAATELLVAANTSRRYLCITNTSAAYVSLGFGANAVLYSGITLSPNGGTYEMSAAAGNLFTGAVNAIASGAASNVGVQEAT